MIHILGQEKFTKYKQEKCLAWQQVGKNEWQIDTDKCSDLYKKWRTLAVNQQWIGGHEYDNFAKAGRAFSRGLGQPETMLDLVKKVMYHYFRYQAGEVRFDSRYHVMLPWTDLTLFTTGRYCKG